jgi:hypothetical protein
MQEVLMTLIDNLTPRDLHLAFAKKQFAEFKNDPQLLLEHIKRRTDFDYAIGEHYSYFYWPLFASEESNLDNEFIALAKQLQNCLVHIIRIKPDFERDIDDDVTSYDDETYIALVAPPGFPMFKSRGPGDHVIGVIVAPIDFPFAQSDVADTPVVL